MTNSKFIERVVIVAAGDAIRMNDYTLNGALPKILMSLGNKTILTKQLELFSKIASHITIICKTSHMFVIQEFAKFAQIDDSVHIDYQCYDKSNGTFLTIKDLTDKYDINNALVVWSDILPVNDTAFIAAVEAILDAEVAVFADNVPRHRFNVESGEVAKCKTAANGNVVGCYYFRKLSHFMRYVHNIASIKPLYNVNNNYDIADMLELLNDHFQFDIESVNIDVYDIGDADKYMQYMNVYASIEARYFNDIDIHHNIVVKRSTCDKGKQLIQKEYDFYKIVESNSMMPSIKTSLHTHLDGNNEFAMQKIHYPTVHEFVSSVELDAESNKTASMSMLAKELYIAFCRQMALQFHGYLIKVDAIDNSDILYEYLSTTFQRLESVKHLTYLNPAVQKIKFVNNMTVPTLSNIVARLSKYIVNRQDIEMGFIHGDPNTCNTFVDISTGKFMLIDPRGYFGKTTAKSLSPYGDVAYDFAKFAYGLTGYSQFNLDKNFTCQAVSAIATHGYAIEFDAGIIDLDSVVEDTYVKVLVSLIWLKLPAYIHNNPLKALCAYTHGLALLNKYLPEL